MRCRLCVLLRTADAEPTQTVQTRQTATTLAEFGRDFALAVASGGLLYVLASVVLS